VPRVLVSRLQRLYVNLAVRREYSSPGCSGSTSTTPRVRVPWHAARLVTRLVAPLVVDYSASRRLVIDYFAFAARPGASARRAGSSSTTSPSPRIRVPQHVAWLVVDYFAYAARPGDSARRAARHAARRRLHRASGCLGMSCGSSRGSSRHSSSTTPRVRVPRHVARLVNFSNIRRGSIADRHGFIYKPALAATAKSFI
jgi:hypothetical protein